MLDDFVTDSTNSFRLTPRTIITLYVFSGGAWIVITTLLLLRYNGRVSSFASVDVVEESIFIVLTALPLYKLLRSFEMRIQRSLQQYRDLVEFLPVAIGIYSQGRLVYANAAGLQLLGNLPIHEISRTPFFDIVVTDDIAASQARIDEAERGQPVPFTERQFKLPNGNLLMAEVAGIPFSYAGKPAALLVAHDVTVRKQLEEERLHIYEELERRVQRRTYELERRRRVAEGMNSIVAKLNSNSSVDEILEYVVAQTSQVLGSKAGAIYRLDHTGKKLTIQTAVGLPLEFVQRVQIPFGQAVVGKAVSLRQPVTLMNICELATQTTSNEELLPLAAMLENDFCSVLAIPLVIKDSMYGGLVLYFPDERAFGAEEIEIAVVFSGQLALAIENARLLDEVEAAAASAERNRLAHDLHDSVSQILFSASLIAEVLPTIWEIDQTEGMKRLHELRQLTRGALAEMRTLLHELRPTTLEDTPLPELLRHLVEATMGRASIPVELIVKGQIELPPPVHVALYRIAQQALDNIFRHAKASYSDVNLQAQPDYVELQIRDNGRGFDPAMVKPGRLGLEIMRERAAAVGARLDIQSCIGDGTCISLHYIIGEQSGEGDT